MFTDETDHWTWLLAIIGVAVVIAGMLFIHDRKLPIEAKTIEQPASVSNAEPLPARPPIQPAPTAQPTRSRTIAKIYECNVQGQRVLSDARTREIRAPNAMQAQDTGILDEGPVYASRPYVPFEPPAKAGRPQRDSSECGYLQAEKDRINARMRRAYMSYEGEGFRDRLREIESAMHEGRCDQ